MITLPEDCSMPLYQALYLQLRQEIQSGALAYGKKLPSKRKLSEQLGISVNTVDSAYCQLEAEGFIQSSPPAGLFRIGRRHAASGKGTGTCRGTCA